ncbi:MAG: hypothetical protein JWM34_340 [Ilumatobacteraceae bacterium]|nr:hypothetical protein [Ilumatobacteraceae bacterium]
MAITSEDPTSDRSADESSTITDVLAAYVGGGFSGEFSAVEGGRLQCHECDREMRAAEVVMSSLRRLEGASDPADMVAIVAVTCPHCATKGTAVLGFGPAASPEDSDVLAALRDHRHDAEAPGNSAPGEVAGDDTRT